MMANLRLVFMLASLITPLTGFANHYSLWEAGVGMLASRFPAYRGASTTSQLFIPIPYFVYRGKHFRIDEDGIRTRFYRYQQFAIEFSLGGNLPVDSDNAKARQDMEDLAPIVELGPSFELQLYAHRPRLLSMWLRIPLRPAISFDRFKPQWQGIVLAPFIEIIKVWQQPNIWQMSIWAGPLFASQTYHDYFYSVPKADTTIARQAYQATSGYSGARMAGALLFMQRHFSIGLFLRYDNLSGATFADSPLIETNHYFVSGLTVVWVATHSRQTVSH